IVERDGRLPLARGLTGGGSYQSTSERRLHFGLGTGVETVDVAILWTSGIVDRWEAIPVNQSILAIEGREFVGGFGCVESAIGDRQLLEASHPVTNDRRLGTSCATEN